MTDNEAKALGLRAAVWDGWLWLPGMGDCDGRRLTGSSMVGGVEMAHHTRGGEAVLRGIPFARLGQPDLRDAATMGAALSLWQAQPGHVFRVPCPVLTNAAAYGLTDPRTIRALVGAMEAAP